MTVGGAKEGADPPWIPWALTPRLSKSETERERGGGGGGVCVGGCVWLTVQRDTANRSVSAWHIATNKDIPYSYAVSVVS